MIKLRGFGGEKRVLGPQPGIVHPDGGPGRRHQAHQALCLGRRAHHAAGDRGAHGRRPSIRSRAAASASTSSPAGPRRSTTRWACGRARSTSASATTTAPSTCTIMRELWETGASQLQGRVLPDGGLHALARVRRPRRRSSAPGRAPRGMRVRRRATATTISSLAKGINTPTRASSRPTPAMAEAARQDRPRRRQLRRCSW